MTVKARFLKLKICFCSRSEPFVKAVVRMMIDAGTLISTILTEVLGVTPVADQSVDFVTLTKIPTGHHARPKRAPPIFCVSSAFSRHSSNHSILIQSLTSKRIELADGQSQPYE